MEKIKMTHKLLKGRDLSQFKYYLRKRLGAEYVELPDAVLLEIVNKNVGFEYISRRAIRVQKYYMRRILGT
jgi:hypothetical protein